MSKARIQAVVRFLGCSSNHDGLSASWADGNERSWRRLLGRLDAAGLSLYFLHKLRAECATDAIPERFLFQLEERQRRNAGRIARMKDTFDELNHLFVAAELQYAVLKGFSLVPEFCPDATLRAQSDLDYLVAPDSLYRACQILVGLGYVLKRQTGEEFAFWIPSAEPRDHRAQYDPDAPFMIELHCAIWNHGVCEVPGTERSIRFDRMELRRWNESCFPALPESEIFLGQILHAFRHLMLAEVRPSWLFELGYFVQLRQNDHRLWEETAELVRSEPMTAAIVGIVTGLAAEVFGRSDFAAPFRFHRVTALTQQWLKNYGRDVVLESCGAYGTRLFPKSKLLLFLMEQYSSGARGLRYLRRRSLIPLRGLRGIAKPPKKSGSTPLEIVAEKTNWFVSRILYHAGADIRYLVEIPRWRRITRRLSAGQRPALDPV